MNRIVGLFIPYLCDLFFIFSLIFTVINHITSLKQTHLFLVHFLEYLLLFLDDNDSSASGCCLAFCLIFSQFHPGVAYKKVAYVKNCA